MVKLIMAARERVNPEEDADHETSRAAKPPEAAGDSRDQAFIGTSGWKYSSWKPGFYPDMLPERKFLEYYATQLNSVEINYTFYNLPTAKMLTGWLAASGARFRFSFKAPQRVTHILRLRDSSDTVAELSRAFAPVVAAGRMGVVLFQLPPNFKADVTRLDSFLAQTTAYGLRMAFEFRNSTWLCDEMYAVLRHHGAALCVADSDDFETPDVTTAPFAYYRFRTSGYSAARLKTIEGTLRRRSAEGEVFAYFKHDEEPTGAIYAIETLRKLQQ
jgi:uncharacterized protein YecE (DUF72 family)